MSKLFNHAFSTIQNNQNDDNQFYRFEPVTARLFVVDVKFVAETAKLALTNLIDASERNVDLATRIEFSYELHNPSLEKARDSMEGYHAVFYKDFFNDRLEIQRYINAVPLADFMQEKFDWLESLLDWFYRLYRDRAEIQAITRNHVVYKNGDRVSHEDMQYYVVK